MTPSAFSEIMNSEIISVLKTETCVEGRQSHADAIVLPLVLANYDLMISPICQQISWRCRSLKQSAYVILLPVGKPKSSR